MKTTHLWMCWLVAAAPLVGAAVPVSGTCPHEAKLLSRPVVVGASVSAGFGWKKEAGAPGSVGELLERRISTPHTPVRSVASVWVFKDPPAAGRWQVKRLQGADATLTVAADFLFWFLYGSGLEPSQRLARLEEGLALLESLPGVLLVGEVPRVEPERSPLLTPDDVPPPEVLAQANRRIAQWATGRARVVVLPVGGWMHQAPPGSLQADGLHLTREGASLLVSRMLERLREVCPAPVEVSAAGP